MLALRRGVVLAAGDPGGPIQELEVRLGGERRTAMADVVLVGASGVGDDVIVNLGPLDALVHANLTRGLAGEVTWRDDATVFGSGGDASWTGTGAAPAIKLDATSLRHPVAPVEHSAPAERSLTLPTGAPVAICLAHAQLAPLAWAFHEAAPGARLGYVQTGGGALAGAMGETVGLLRRRGLLAGHLTAGPAYGGEGEAVTTAGALQHGFAERHWHAAVCAPGPGAVDSGTALGHAGMVALEAAHTAAALGCQGVVCIHRTGAAPDVSHPTRMMLELALVAFVVAHAGERPRAGLGRHDWRAGAADLDGYAAAGLPTRALVRDPAPFAAALAAGTVLAQCAA
jgi:hypothetical protein